MDSRPNAWVVKTQNVRSGHDPPCMWLCFYTHGLVKGEQGGATGTAGADPNDFGLARLGAAGPERAQWRRTQAEATRNEPTIRNKIITGGTG
jgi:hypothetical protein